MDNSLPIFKPWAPNWLINVTLFVLIMPNLVLFFLPMTNLNAAAGYYGSEPADMQFAVALFYAGYVGFYSLERRFFSFLAAKEYFIIFTFLQLAATFICYETNEVFILFPLRFLQGMLFACNVNISLSLMFSRIATERAREIGFSVFFGLLLCALPFNNLVTADLIDTFNYNIVYKIAVFSYVPGLLLLLTLMNNVRLNVKFPLYQLDWQSFVLYSIILSLIGYICIFGQEYYWLEDIRILGSVVAIFGLGIVYAFRQKSLKRPYISLAVFKFRNFSVGLIVLFVMYICRFASGITNTFFTQAYGFDPMHISYINLFNLFGLIIGVTIACAMILQKRRIRSIWIPGFLLLLAFHFSMYFLFDIQGDEFNYFIPLFIQGLGVGLIMVPTIVYTISSVTLALGPSAAAICLAIRYLGFCVSIALINFFTLFGKSSHYNAFQDHLTSTDPMSRLFLQKQVANLTHKGMTHGKAVKAAYKTLVNKVNTQGQLRFAMDYYEMMAWLIIATILFIALTPYLNRTMLYLKSRRLSPA
ncbi:beta-carotene 15,15'-monooxygenase [Flavobacterium adhaerens]|uniref:beta-carotene 15,15'-monooxygenase n=1 Tax=Flavobacterium adhaerens TaxID=3149043 RepID=UPI0032B55EF2